MIQRYCFKLNKKAVGNESMTDGFLYDLNGLCHSCCNECEDGVELRKRTIDKSLCEHIVSL